MQAVRIHHWKAIPKKNHYAVVAGQFPALAGRAGCKIQYVFWAILRARNHRGKIPGAGRRVQCGAQPDEASNTLTRRPATHHHAPDSRARLQRGCGLDIDADWLRTLPFRVHGLSVAWSWLRPDQVRVQSGAAASSRPVHGHGLVASVSMIVETARPFRVYYAATSRPQNPSLAKG